MEREAVDCVCKEETHQEQHGKGVDWKGDGGLKQLTTRSLKTRHPLTRLKVVKVDQAVLWAL